VALPHSPGQESPYWVLCQCAFELKFAAQEEVVHDGVKKLLKQYASTLVEGLVLAVAFALVDRVQSAGLTALLAGGAGLVVGAFVGLGLAEHSRESDHQV
jgi:hypothetical protein